MTFHQWLILIGGLLLVIALIHPVVKRLPITATIIYLGAGIALGPYGFGVLEVDALRDAAWLHHGSEVVVLISLFTVGLKLRLPVRDRALRPAFVLAFASMAITVALIALAGVLWLELSVGAAVLLGGALAPTDPVLASDVQLRHAGDRDNARLTLSAEAGLNDGTAFPFVMLGLGLLQLHELGQWGWRWLLMDCLWAVFGGLAIGGGLGYGLGRLVISLQRKRGNVVVFGEYLVLGLIGASYGTAIQLHAYGFLAVFAAGLSLRIVERHASARRGWHPGEQGAVKYDNDGAPEDPRAGPAYLAGALLATNEQLEHILEVAVVAVVGATLASVGVAYEVLWFAPLVFIVIRPLAAVPVLLVRRLSRADFAGIAWFGVRGIGSVYYVMYAVERGLPDGLSIRLVSLTLTVVAASIVIHGVSVTPLFERVRSKKR